ncbi:hypothetical protein MTO96_052144 [Rhipicephalus appendiculatus]
MKKTTSRKTSSHLESILVEEAILVAFREVSKETLTVEHQREACNRAHGRHHLFERTTREEPHKCHDIARQHPQQRALPSKIPVKLSRTKSTRLLLLLRRFSREIPDGDVVCWRTRVGADDRARKKTERQFAGVDFFFLNSAPSTRRRTNRPDQSIS